MRPTLSFVLVPLLSVLAGACDPGDASAPAPTPGAGGKADDQSAEGDTPPPADAYQDAMLQCVQSLISARTEDEFDDLLIPTHSCLDDLNNRVEREQPALADFTEEADAERDAAAYLCTKLGFVWDSHEISMGLGSKRRQDYVCAIRSEVDFAAWGAQLLADDGSASPEFTNVWWGQDGRTVARSLQPCLDHMDDTFYPLSRADGCIDDVAKTWREQLRVFVLGTGIEVDPRPSDLTDEAETKIAAMCEAATSDDLSQCKIELRVSLWSRVAEILTLAGVLEGELPAPQ